MSVASGRDILGLQRLARAWRVAAVVGLAAFTAHTLLGSRLGLDDFFNRWLYNALILLGLAACLIRVARVRAERGAWLALSVGVAAWAVAELLFDFAYGGSPPYPSVADGFYLAFYPACYVALLLLLRARLSRSSAAASGSTARWRGSPPRRSARRSSSRSC